MSAPVDQADRDRARLGLDANAVVEAGAGTGKTTLLTDRLLFQLLAGERAAPVTRLVALTFTEKAAAEIKVRLADKLSDVASGKAAALLSEAEARFGVDGETAARLARRALEDLDKAQIGTIHSFAAHVLRLFPVEAGVDPGFKVDDGTYFEELFEAEWAAFLDVELGEKPPRESAWLDALRLLPLEDVRALARELSTEKLELSSVGRPDPESAERFERLAQRLEEIKASQPPPKGNSKIDVTIKVLCGKLRALAASARAVDPALPERLSHDEVPKSSWPKAWDPELEPVYELARAACAVSSADKEALARRACELVLPFAKRFRRAYTRRGFVSFDGLLRKARDLVRDHSGAREELKRQYSALFIDEFQDTDPLQGEFLMLLAEAPGRCAKGWETAKLGDGRLFVVGDPKQSIYRFRGADIAAYQRFTERILSEGKASSCDLKANFRSPAGLIGPVNAVFESLMLPQPGLQAPYKPLFPGRSNDPTPAVEVARVRGAVKADALRAVEARVAAAWIAEHCGPGKALRFGDVAILGRTTRPFPELLSALRAAEIPYAIETEKGFYGSPEVLDLLNLLRALDDPQDRAAIAGLLRSPLCLLPDGQLYELARARKLDYARKTGVARADALFSQLASLRERVGRVPLGDLVASALRETNLLELSAKAYHGAQTVANLAKFARLAAQASDERGLTLKEFVGELLAELSDPKGEGESPLADEHLDAVRLLTIHKSKGLEFPVVILTNASGKAAAGKKASSCLDWTSGRAGVRLETSGAASASMAWLEPQEKERQRHEALRLLYVALTRAKKRLLVVGAEKGDSSALTTLLAQAGAWPAPDADVTELTLGAWRVPVRDVDAQKPPELSTARTEKEAREKADEAALAARWKKRLAARDAASEKRRFSSPTALMREAEKGRPLEEGAPGSPVGALVGTLCHRVLELADLAKPPRGKALAEAVARARAALGEAAPADADRAAEEARAALELFFGSPAASELADLTILGREVPFAYAEDGVVVRGAIDLLARAKDGRLLIVDYKTVRDGETRRAELEKRYAPQGRVYARAAGRGLSPSGEGSAKEPEFKLVFVGS